MKIYEELKLLVQSDLYRYCGSLSIRAFIVCYLRYPGFKYTFLLRLCSFLACRGSLIKTISSPLFLLLRHYRYKFGFDIPISTKIGRGLFISHFGSIIINPLAEIGENCNLSVGIVIGKQNRGKKMGVPVIKNHVFIGPGAKIIGNISIGNNSVIGSNSVVVDDVPNNAVVSGIPSDIISLKGSSGYINKVLELK